VRSFLPPNGRAVLAFDSPQAFEMDFVLCSSGLSSDARRRLEASAAALNGVHAPDLTTRPHI